MRREKCAVAHPNPARSYLRSAVRAKPSQVPSQIYEQILIDGTWVVAKVDYSAECTHKLPQFSALIDSETSSHAAHNPVHALDRGKIVDHHAINFDPCMSFRWKLLSGEDHLSRHTTAAQQARHNG